jgi:hypothetical protein
MECRGGGKGKQKDKRINNIKIHNICADAIYNDMYWKLLNNGGWEETGKRE